MRPTPPCAVALSVWILTSFSLVGGQTAPSPAGCVVVGAELPEFYSEGEAVLIRFPFLEAAFRYRKLRWDESSSFVLTGEDQLRLERHDDRGLVLLEAERALWLLPSRPAHSGTYAYLFRSSLFCFSGSITVTIYEAGRENMDMISHPVSESPDRDLTISCPHIKHYNSVEVPRWYKGFDAEAVPLSGPRYRREHRNFLTIRKLSAEDEGVYTCRMTVMFNNALYNISRIWKLQVLAPDAGNDPIQTTSSRITPTPLSVSRPVIVAPANGSITESDFGSSLVIHCKVLVDSQSAALTQVTWLVNGRPVESSHVRERALQTQRREFEGGVEVQLVLLEVQQDDVKAELKCVTRNSAGQQEVITHIRIADSTTVWLLASAVSVCFLLLVLSVFLYQFRPRTHKRTHYVLTSQSSSCGHTHGSRLYYD